MRGRGAATTKVTPEQRALHALAGDLPRGDLPISAQLEYDWLKPAWERGELPDWVPPRDVELDLMRQRHGTGKHRGSNGVPHTMDRSGTTRTYRFFNGWQITAGVLWMAIGAFSAVFPIYGLFTPGFYKGSSAGGRRGWSSWAASWDSWVHGLGSVNFVSEPKLAARS